MVLLLVCLGQLVVGQYSYNPCEHRCEGLKKNVLKISTLFTNGVEENGFGFVVGQRGSALFVATANHVVDADNPKVRAQEIKVGFFGRKGRMETAKRLQLSSINEDLALLEVKCPEGYSWKRDFVSKNVERNTKVSFIGRGDRWTVPTTNQNGVINSGEDVNHEITIDITSVFPGSSGAPVVSEKGIVGMLISDNQTEAKALYIGRIKEIVEKWGYWGMVVENKRVFVEGGFFRMGCSKGKGDQKPVHTIEINSFWMDKYEVTVGQYRKFCRETGRSMPPPPSWGWDDNHPIVNVTWREATSYANWASKRLPTEAEWEYAARGGNKTKNYRYPGDNDPTKVAWYKATTGSGPKYVGTKKANEVLLNDMGGNVAEWCRDWYKSDYYAVSPRQNPKCTKISKVKVVRGGSWFCGSKNLNPKNRVAITPKSRCDYVGFRLVSDVE